MNLKIVILAAGQGTRMKSKIPKVLHKVLDKPMLDHVMEAAQVVTNNKPIVVIGHMSDMVREHLGDKAEIALQEEQLGTGHAVMMAEHYIDDEDEVLILCGDTPLIKGETLKEMTKIKSEGYAAVVMSAVEDDPTGYGRIIRDESNDFMRIREQKDASEEEKAIKEINAGMYIINGKLLKENLSKLSVNNAQREYYLTDVLEHIKNAGHRIGVYQADKMEIMGVNSRLQLSEAERIMRLDVNKMHMANGVTLIDTNSTYIDKNVKIGRDTIIYPNCHIKGNSVIGEDCIIRENTTIEDSHIEDHVTIKSSTILSSKVGARTTIGPYAYLRPKSVLGEDVKIGDFVEVKNAEIGNGSKASHLSYIGDAVVGKNVNIGCGVVFVNYDGKNKFKSIVEDNAFIGSNSNLVAPVTVKEGGYIATGSTVTVDVPEGALCVARAREVIKEGWRTKKGL
ncbi:MAG: bifunctional UDP-N-acetylglucosamine diphosphorylase/glucosamine-1-phosphate N-acetyltransferase GlmU [Acetoanaerobium sp.]|uniref:bifunctional UDP-N-acetylglucosamine diphosphorylase/glucosamine-1-phosphate N-acetyltransferase GlmU n=1 Tax=Acetoanaerobium noterae TaxID=745369 RepID=UPI001B3F0AF9|nr:bifunctional UDP-N-acetylglucosamine diphosphorylase/glucosamine-1-phosphate N-acetyltransferase GlmU [Acetoanaerobium noterae]MBP8762747.1 bifunctional UDP-N-acetylglucosamine diphosphorylase/glucosamine-1-phosphate N-acetyltransferase GlmU [Acetoanaerobium sp.]MBP9499729.1 bifunctional UDP-N-acetylglucosamine diphosphorylase/glucosamine-1-phosphate N-acetyltransferase GlmU [Acetoanaerobium sp.]MBP9562157.1 bifunctional UDP-N-acetylglucosamine diphosphorylase/glucosamine-1-phosphate N-acetyl